MSDSTNTLIEYLQGEACMGEETENLACQHNASQIRSVIHQLLLFRDTLKRIAQCQGGLSSHQAQDVLKETGHCDHSHAIFRTVPTADFPEGWTCTECNKTSTERLVPYS